ncbi:MAG: hypothetical protein ACLU38_03140 [Dysosmobacter sp.]
MAESLGVSRQAVSKWGDRNGGPQHLQSAGAGEAVRRIRGGAAAAGGPDGRGRKLNQTAAARKAAVLLHPPGCRGLTLVFLWKNCYNNLNLEHSAQTVRI